MQMELRREVVARGRRARWLAPAMVLLLLECLLLGAAARALLDGPRLRERRVAVVAAPRMCVAPELIHTTVAPAVADAWLAEPEGLAHGARIVPVIRNGRASGFKLYAIRPGSPFAVLGLRNGDVLREVDGIDVSQADGALAGYERLRLRTAAHVLDVERLGCPVTILVSIG